MNKKAVIRFFGFILIVVFFFIPVSVFAFSVTEMGKGVDKLAEARNLFDRGQADAANSRLDEATKHFENVLARDKLSTADTAQAQENLGYCYWFRHQEERAMTNWKRAATNPAAKTRILKFLADIYNKVLAEKNISRSFTVNRYAVAIDPSLKAEPVAIYTEAARIWLDKGEINIAKAYLDEVIWMEPSRREEIARLLSEAGHRFSQPEQKVLVCRLILDYHPGWQNQAGEVLTVLTQTMDKSSFENLVKRNFNQNFSAIVMEMAYPWREVYRQTFTGVGCTGGDYPEYNDGSIKTALAGKDYQIGYRYTVIDSDFENWRGIGWSKFKQGEWLTVNTMTPGNYETFRNEAGKKFTVVFQKK